MNRDRLDHALVGNGHIIALVAPDTNIDWLCLPRFDGPSVFAGLLDRERGGEFTIDLDGGRVSEQRQHPSTNSVETLLRSAEAQVQIDDFAPLNKPVLVRLLTPGIGRPTVRVRIHPRLDFGRAPDVLESTGRAARVGPVWVTTDGPLRAILSGEPFVLQQPVAIAVAHGDPYDPANAAADRTIASSWDQRFAADLPEPIRRSALCLRAHIYEPTGAIIAAATTSIPEAIGTSRTWDYRYAWIRDGCLATEMLLRLGHGRAARRFMDFLHRTVGRATPQPLYGIGGEAELPESTVSTLRGFAGTGPVRLGNAAALQTQHDTWGQMVWLAERVASEDGVPPSMDRFSWITSLVEGARRVWRTPDAGIWEFRERSARYTFSHVWCWVALDRGASLAGMVGRLDLASTWAEEAREIRAHVLQAADRVGFFAQTLDNDEADASSLMLPMLGFVPFTDPRFVQTLERCERRLAVGGLMRRYVAEDDLGETTSTFSLCTLWWVEALAAMGRRPEAQEVFDRFLGYGNPHGLFSEGVDPATGQLLGNFPQVFTHTGIISAWLALGED